MVAGCPEMVRREGTLDPGSRPPPPPPPPISGSSRMVLTNGFLQPPSPASLSCLGKHPRDTCFQMLTGEKSKY